MQKWILGGDLFESLAFSSKVDVKTTWFSPSTKLKTTKRLFRKRNSLVNVFIIITKVAFHSAFLPPAKVIYTVKLLSYGDFLEKTSYSVIMLLSNRACSSGGGAYLQKMIVWLGAYLRGRLFAKMIFRRGFLEVGVYLRTYSMEIGTSVTEQS